VSADFKTLARFLSLETLPILRVVQMNRMRDNIRAGIDLGIPAGEAYAMAAEDFATPAEKLAEACLIDGIAWLAVQDKNEVREQLLANGWPYRRGR
jgi:hypothetical protein